MVVSDLFVIIVVSWLSLSLEFIDWLFNFLCWRGICLTSFWGLGILCSKVLSTVSVVHLRKECKLLRRQVEL